MKRTKLRKIPVRPIQYNVKKVVVDESNKGLRVINVRSSVIEKEYIQWEGENYYHLGREGYESSNIDPYSKMVLKKDYRILERPFEDK